MPPKAAAEKKPASKAPASKAPADKKEAGKKTAATGEKKKRTKTRKETYSSYIYKGTLPLLIIESRLCLDSTWTRQSRYNIITIGSNIIHHFQVASSISFGTQIDICAS